MLSEAPEFEGWQRHQQERLHRLFMQALHLLIQRALQRRDDEAAQSWIARLLEVEPWHEEAHRQLMRLLARQGQRQAALEQYEVCCCILDEELGRAPQSETVALYEALRAGPVAPTHNLPASQVGFVGRERELAVLAQWLGDPACRLITLLDLGGSGKTRLAVQAAAQQARAAPLRDEHPFADGLYLVDLSGVPAPGEGALGADIAALAAHRVTTAIGRTLGLEQRSTDPTAHLLRWLHSRAVLLLLDNLEHVVAGRELLSLLLQRAPRVKLLVTSRERLHVPEEWVLELEGLTAPASPDEVEQSDAGRLFMQQARQGGWGAALSVDERADVARICALTQGLPLALVLAAHGLRALSTAAIARELEQGMELLATTAPGMTERQRSVTTVLEATWARLAEPDRAVLRQSAVFRGGFTRKAARAVAHAQLADLLRLRDHALLHYDKAGERYAVHELVRQYAMAQLAAQPEEEARTRAQHAAFYAAFVQQQAAALYQSSQAQEAIGADMANVRAVWAWAVAHVDAGLLEQMRADLAKWYELSGLLQEWAEAFEGAAAQLRAALMHAARPDPAVQRTLGFLLVHAARALNWQARYDRAFALLEEARDLARATGSLELEARVAYVHGGLASRQRDLPGAQHRMEQALALARAIQAHDLEAESLSMLGVGAVNVGDYRQAHAYFDRALSLFRTLGDHRGEGSVDFYRGLAVYEQGDFVEARRLYDSALGHFRAIGWRLYQTYVLDTQSVLHDEAWGQHLEAEACFAQDLWLCQELGDAQREAFALAGQGRNALYQGDLECARAAFDQALSVSREVRSPATIILALRGQGLLAHY